MDSLTQITLGAAIGEACLGKKMGNKGALWGAVFSVVPDFRFNSSIIGKLVYRILGKE